jgi:hypothetical protein
MHAASGTSTIAAAALTMNRLYAHRAAPAVCRVIVDPARTSARCPRKPCESALATFRSIEGPRISIADAAMPRPIAAQPVVQPFSRLNASGPRALVTLG